MLPGIKRLGLVALVAAVFIGAHSASAGGPVIPDWMKTAATQSLPSYEPETPAVVLFEETTLTVRPDGKSTERVRRVVKILRQQGRRYGNVTVWFNAGSPVNYLHVWSIGPDGHQYAMKDSEVTEIGLQSGGILYEDYRAKLAEPPARDVNAIIGYEYEQKKPFYESEDSFDIQESIPKLQQAYILRLPAGWQYKTSWHRHEAVRPTEINNELHWEVKDEPALDMRDIVAAPSARGLRARGVISYFPADQPRTSGDWTAIGANIQNLNQDRAKPTPELAAKAQQLVAGKTDFTDKVQAIGEFVQQQIRYVAIEIGIGGIQPHNAADIFRYRYGDCKDKATLLAAMLGSVGIHSTWVYVDTERGYMTPDAPSFSGNHAIAAIQLPDGYESSKLHSVVKAKSGKRFLIFDPTWEYTPFGVLESNLQGSYGILVDGANSQLIEFPVLDPSLNLVERTAHFKLTADGSLAGDVTVRRDGDIAASWRELYHEASAKDQREVMERSLGEDLGEFTLGPTSVENTNALTKEFVQRYDVTVPQYARAQGPLILVRPRVLGSDSFELDRKIRNYPVELGETRTVSDDFDVQLPAGYTVDEIPDPVSVDMGFAMYKSRTEIHGDTLHYSRQYTVRQVEVPAESYHSVQEMVGQIERDERSQAVFKKKSDAP